MSNKHLGLSSQGSTVKVVPMAQAVNGESSTLKFGGSSTRSKEEIRADLLARKPLAPDHSGINVPKLSSDGDVEVDFLSGLDDPELDMVGLSEGSPASVMSDDPFADGESALDIYLREHPEAVGSSAISAGTAKVVCLGQAKAQDFPNEVDIENEGEFPSEPQATESSRSSSKSVSVRRLDEDKAALSPSGVRRAVAAATSVVIPIKEKGGSDPSLMDQVLTLS